MSSIRTFVASEVSAQVRDRACDAIAKLEASGAKVKWVERENLHLTLNFLGDVDERNIHEVCSAVSNAAGSILPFEFNCAGVGAFPNANHPRTIWLGVDRGHNEMCDLQSTIETALDELGYPKENRKFHPHLTLGRIRSGGSGLARLSSTLSEMSGFDAGSVRTKEVVVLSSQLKPSGPAYEALARVPLAKDKDTSG